MKARLRWVALGGLGGGVTVFLLLLGLALVGSSPTPALAGRAGLSPQAALPSAQEDPWSVMHAACLKGDYNAMGEAMRQITPEEMQRMHQSPEEMWRRMGMSPEQMPRMMQDNSMLDLMRRTMGGVSGMWQGMMGGFGGMMRGMMPGGSKGRMMP